VKPLFIGKVCGSVVATIKHSTYQNYKLLLVDRLGLDGQVENDYWIAVDLVQAGPGDTVLVLDEGNSARQLVDQEPMGAIRAVIVGIVDQVELVKPARGTESRG